MGIFDKVMGKRSRTAANIAKEIATQEDAVAASLERIEKAQIARKAAIEDFDDTRHKAADDEIAAGRRDIERREVAIEALKVAHVKQADAEAREALWRELEEERRVVRELDDAIDEYNAAAEKVSNFIRSCTAAAFRRDALVKRARALGEDIEPYPIKGEALEGAVGTLPYGDRPGYFHYAGEQPQVHYPQRLR